MLKYSGSHKVRLAISVIFSVGVTVALSIVTFTSYNLLPPLIVVAPEFVSVPVADPDADPASPPVVSPPVVPAFSVEFSAGATTALPAFK